MNLSDPEMPEQDIDALFLKYCDGTLSPEEFAWLGRLIQVDPAARTDFLSLCVQTSALTEHHAVLRASLATANREESEAPSCPPVQVGSASSARKGWSYVVGVSLAAAAAAIFLWIGQQLEAPTDADALASVATLTRSTGQVRIQSAVFAPVSVNRATIRSGDTVSTVGIDSSAELTLPNGTSVVLSNNTEAMFEGPGAGHIAVRRGNLAAEVVPHPKRTPLRITTPEASVAVHDTQMFLTCVGGKTRVGVFEGKIRVTDPTDETTVDMGAGDQLEALGGALRRLPNPPIPDNVALRFGPRTMDGWGVGRLVRENLLLGSTGAVRTIPRVDFDGNKGFGAESENRWTSGMFSIHPDTWISARYRVAERGWFELVVVARSYDIRHRPGVVYGAPADFMACEPGVWRTVHYRLADFKIIQQPEVPSPLVGFLFVLNSGARDVGLTVDQLWVNRGDGPTPFPE